MPVLLLNSVVSTTFEKDILVKSKLVKLPSWSNPLELCSDHSPGWLCRPGGNNKDPAVWLDGDKPHPKYIFKHYMSLTNSKEWTMSNPMDILQCFCALFKRKIILWGFE